MVNLINHLFPSLLDYYIKIILDQKKIYNDNIIFYKIKKILSGNFKFFIKRI